jgi:hypothetical protein
LVSFVWQFVGPFVRQEILSIHRTQGNKQSSQSRQKASPPASSPDRHRGRRAEKQQPAEVDRNVQTTHNFNETEINTNERDFNNIIGNERKAFAIYYCNDIRSPPRPQDGENMYR